MAPKKKAAQAAPTAPDQNSAIARLIQQRTEKFKGFKPSEMATAEEVDSFTRYLGVIDLCHQWALGRPGYAMGRILHLLGKEGSGKTSRMYHLIRLAFDAGGFGAMIETEYAMSSEQMKSYLGPHYDNFQSLFNQPNSFERGLKMISTYLTIFAEIDPHGLLPKVLVYDSIAGSGTDAVVKDDFEAGKIAGGISEKARILRDFLENIKPRLKDTNTLLVLGNHGKAEIATGIEARVKKSEVDTIKGQGGRAIDFNSTYWEYVKRGANLKDSEGAKNGFAQAATFKKNKLRFPGRQVQMNVVFEEGIVYSPHTIAALAATGVCGFEKLPGGYYCCEEIGVPESSKMRAGEIYQVIHSPENIGRFISEFDILMPVRPGNVMYPLSWNGQVPILTSETPGAAAAGTTVQILDEDEMEIPAEDTPDE